MSRNYWNLLLNVLYKSRTTIMIYNYLKYFASKLLIKRKMGFFNLLGMVLHYTKIVTMRWKGYLELTLRCMSCYCLMVLFNTTLDFIWTNLFQFCSHIEKLQEGMKSCNLNKISTSVVLIQATNRDRTCSLWQTCQIMIHSCFKFSVFDTLWVSLLVRWQI